MRLKLYYENMMCLSMDIGFAQMFVDIDTKHYVRSKESGDTNEANVNNRSRP